MLNDFPSNHTYEVRGFAGHHQIHEDKHLQYSTYLEFHIVISSFFYLESATPVTPTLGALHNPA